MLYSRGINLTRISDYIGNRALRDLGAPLAVASRDLGIIAVGFQVFVKNQNTAHAAVAYISLEESATLAFGHYIKYIGNILNLFSQP